MIHRFQPLETLRQCLYLIWWWSCLAESILHCFADSPSPYKQLSDDDDYVSACEREPDLESPETTSSFLNRLTMWWFNTICIKGIRKPLEVNDLYELNTKDTSRYLVPKWEKLWDECMRSERQSCYLQWNNMIDLQSTMQPATSLPRSSGACSCSSSGTSSLQ